MNRRYYERLSEWSEPEGIKVNREGKLLGRRIGPVDFRDDGTAVTDTVVGIETGEPSPQTLGSRAPVTLSSVP